MKIICTTEYLFLEARRLCEAVQMSAKTQRPAPSNDIGYLAICFLYFNCAELALPHMSMLATWGGETRPTCFFKDIQGPGDSFVLFLCIF